MENGLQDSLLKKPPDLDSPVGFAFGMREVTTAVPVSSQMVVSLLCCWSHAVDGDQGRASGC